MAYLGDYLGHLLSEITIARMQSDVEAIRVAELYSAHPLLRNMPVPHFRLPTVEIDVPVAIKKVEEAGEKDMPRGTPTLAELRKTFDNVLTQRLGKENIRLSAVQKQKIKSVLDKKAEELERPTAIAIDVGKIADDFAREASAGLTELGKTGDAATRQALEEKLKEATRVEFLKLRKEPPRLEVLVTTPELKEAGPSEVISKIHLSISEEAFEWTTIESDGDKQQRLVME